MNVKLILCTAMLVLAGSVPALAQRDVIESVVVRSDNTNDPVRSIEFGYSPSYTDGMDCFSHNECEIPAVPPSFWAMFIDQHEGFGLNKDIRGVPDSVASGAATKFTLQFELDITRDNSPSVYIAFPDAMTPGIDSVVFIDKITHGTAFHHAFTEGNTQVLIPFGDAIRAVLMTVYYDRRTARAPMPVLAERRSEPLLSPNPASRGSALALRTPMPEATHFEIFNLLGENVGSALQAPQTPGLYLVRLLGRHDELLATEKLVVGER